MSLDFATDYVTVEQATEYHAARGNAAWATAAASPDDARTSAIRRATDYIVGKYNGRWIEEPDEEDLDDEIIFAICEGALRELATPGVLAPDLDRGGDIRSIQAGSVGIVYAGSASAQTVFASIDNLLSGLVYAGGTTRLVRA